jgi:hypothetical protein
MPGEHTEMEIGRVQAYAAVRSIILPLCINRENESTRPPLDCRTHINATSPSNIFSGQIGRSTNVQMWSVLRHGVGVGTEVGCAVERSHVGACVKQLIEFIQPEFFYYTRRTTNHTIRQLYCAGFVVLIPETTFVNY